MSHTPPMMYNDAMRATHTNLATDLATAITGLGEIERIEARRLFQTCPDDCCYNDAQKCKETKLCHTVESKSGQIATRTLAQIQRPERDESGDPDERSEG